MVFSGHFIQTILDNPVYCGKIAYGRRQHEKVKGKKNEYRLVYRILEHFSEFYDIMNDEERKELLLELIKEIRIYPEGENEYPLKSIKFNFPILQNGKEVDEIFLNKQPNVDGTVRLSVLLFCK